MRQYRPVAALLTIAMALTASRTAGAQSEPDLWVDPGAPVQPVAPALQAPGPLTPDVMRLLMFQEQKKEPWAAVAIELLPGCGSVYADDWTGAAITWGLLLGNSLAMVAGINMIAAATMRTATPIATPHRR